HKLLQLFFYPSAACCCQIAKALLQWKYAGHVILNHAYAPKQQQLKMIYNKPQHSLSVDGIQKKHFHHTFACRFQCYYESSFHLHNASLSASLSEKITAQGSVHCQRAYSR